MIHLVCYSQSAIERARFKDLFPPALSTMIFEEENLLIDFLKTLKIPTQIILDLETFQSNLHAFLIRNDFHHTICFKKEYAYQECLETLRHGALLVNPEELNSLQWWWNRTAIVSSKIKGEALPQTGVIAVLSPTDRPLEKPWGQIFLEHAAQNAQHCRVLPVENFIKKTETLEGLQNDHSPLSTLVLTHLDKVFPRDLRVLLKRLHLWSQEHKVRIVIDIQSSQVLFESLLDWSTIDSQQGIYRLQLNRTKIIHKSSFVGMASIFPQAMTLEYVRYTWLAGQNIS